MQCFVLLLTHLIAFSGFKQNRLIHFIQLWTFQLVFYLFMLRLSVPVNIFFSHVGPVLSTLGE